MIRLKLKLLLILFFIRNCYSRHTKPPKIVVIGGGISGVAAAVKLIENGYEDVAILEAENRIGGRIFSIPYGSGFIDIGAQWVHGVTNNAVYDLVHDHFDFGNTGSDHADSLYLAFNGMKLEQEKCMRLYEAGHEVLSEYGEMAKSTKSLGAFFISKFKELLKSSRYSDIQGNLPNQFINLFERDMNVWNGSESWFDLSARLNTISGVNEGTQVQTWRDRGYKTVFDFITVSWFLGLFKYDVQQLQEKRQNSLNGF